MPSAEWLRSDRRSAVLLLDVIAMTSNCEDVLSWQDKAFGIEGANIMLCKTYLSTILALVNSLTFRCFADTASPCIFDRSGAFGRREFAGGWGHYGTASTTAPHRICIARFGLFCGSRRPFGSSTTFIAALRDGVVLLRRRALLGRI